MWVIDTGSSSSFLFEQYSNYADIATTCYYCHCRAIFGSALPEEQLSSTVVGGQSRLRPIPPVSYPRRSFHDFDLGYLSILLYCLQIE
jgi:hypothetical protein